MYWEVKLIIRDSVIYLQGKLELKLLAVSRPQNFMAVKLQENAKTISGMVSYAEEFGI